MKADYTTFMRVKNTFYQTKTTLDTMVHIKKIYLSDLRV